MWMSVSMSCGLAETRTQPNTYRRFFFVCWWITLSNLFHMFKVCTRRDFLRLKMNMFKLFKYIYTKLIHTMFEMDATKPHLPYEFSRKFWNFYKVSQCFSVEQEVLKFNSFITIECRMQIFEKKKTISLCLPVCLNIDFCWDLYTSINVWHASDRKNVRKF